MAYGPSEQLKQTGFAAHVSPRHGFAALLPTKARIEVPRKSFAADMERGEAELAAERAIAAGQKLPSPPKRTPRARRHDASKKQGEYYPWPDMFIGSKLDTKAAKPWRQYGDSVELSARGRIGRYVGHANLQLVLIGQNELHSALNERYDGTARNPHARARKDRARSVIRNINELIRGLADDEHTLSLVYELSESPDLLERAKDPDGNPEWLGQLACDIANGNRQRLLDDSGIGFKPEPQKLWTPATLEVVGQEGYGESGIGLAVRGAFMHSKRRALIDEMCSPLGGLGLNPAHFNEDKGSVIQLVDTSPLPAAGLVYSLPSKGQPIEFIAQTPRAYAPNM